MFRFERCRTRDDFRQVIDAMVQWASVPEHRESAKRLAGWILQVLWHERLPAEPVLNLDDIQECETMLREQVKQWERELHEEGVQEGIEKGIEKGEAGVVLRQLERKFGSVSDEFRRRVDSAGSEQLLIWAERILTAEKIADVFKT